MNSEEDIELDAAFAQLDAAHLDRAKSKPAPDLEFEGTGIAVKCADGLWRNVPEGANIITFADSFASPKAARLCPGCLCPDGSCATCRSQPPIRKECYRVRDYAEPIVHFLVPPGGIKTTFYKNLSDIAADVPSAPTPKPGEGGPLSNAGTGETAQGVHSASDGRVAPAPEATAYKVGWVCARCHQSYSKTVHPVRGPLTVNVHCPRCDGPPPAAATGMDHSMDAVLAGVFGDSPIVVADIAVNEDGNPRLGETYLVSDEEYSRTYRRVYRKGDGVLAWLRERWLRLRGR